MWEERESCSLLQALPIPLLFLLRTSSMVDAGSKQQVIERGLPSMTNIYICHPLGLLSVSHMYIISGLTTLYWVAN